MCSGANMTTPRASNTSADPDLLDTERFPCLATRTPHAAATTAAAVEKFTVWCPSPPVPTMSKQGVGPPSTTFMCLRITLTNAATSLGVSPCGHAQKHRNTNNIIDNNKQRTRQHSWSARWLAIQQRPSSTTNSMSLLHHHQYTVFFLFTPPPTHCLFFSFSPSFET